uniref:Uncharacterized protein n=1 Tax=Arundo donax TaxID=35708 RepID=A0A0A9GVP6_ARUDO
MCRWRVAVAGGLLPLPGMEASSTHQSIFSPTTFVVLNYRIIKSEQVLHPLLAAHL